ncbi:efflux RND transporter periplasmic adaptor subunit [Sunxiuqinia elliptica]|uniref:RND family efflux transporter MFP subunit n=1 Tax=Sunxiuqinia elliptica TaxID=655355 RepID=A0A4R6H386_9BACT|nr:efflux RND transporter periplasmic adaptor subunit [Sunxiuqinia elliptica]TDO02603.1 RND family efflux transporter MFP subunit [Sunxiuqinia elliptica]TDO58659.1 RND family efflux transporter MFP subunit [Sunxiuqinia elliptica]
MKIKIYHLITILALLGLGACNNQNADSETEVAIPVSVEDLKPGFIEQTINTTGTVAATKEASLLTEMSGRYALAVNPATGKPFMLGDKVKQGQVIVQLEDEEYVNNIGLEAKKLNLDISEQQYTKQKSLFDKGGVTQSELSNAEVSAVNARDSYKLAQIQLEKMKVRAPFTGVITGLPYFTAGTKVASNAEVATLMSYETLNLEVNLPEKYINEVDKNQVIRVMNYTLPEDTLQGKVGALSPAISTETRTFKGNLEVQNEALKLRPGMFVQAEIILDRKDSVIVIPKDVILSNQRGKSVFIVVKGTAEQKQVTLGYENQDRVEITSGLKANDRLVVKGFETLRDRSKVKIIK